MSAAWQLQDAKARFSELVDDALRDGPQLVTRRGEAVVVVVPIDTWRKLAPATSATALWAAPTEATHEGFELPAHVRGGA